MTDANRLWEGDVNETVIDEWTAGTTPFERVREVLRSTTTPQYAKEIAERAQVSEPTARKHLNLLTDAGIAEAVETGRGTQYKRSRQTVAMQRISDLHREFSREALAEGIKDLRHRIQTYQDEFDATDPDDFVLKFESSADEDWASVAEWRALEESLDVAQAALALYDFTPDHDGGRRDTHTNGGESTSRGAFAGEHDGVSA